ncbi:MAG TPA: alpha-galactosidase, partial [Trichococcus flocculiformis]|nr:alpha-galactosidase [Trichococcus flocculiformis]
WFEPEMVNADSDLFRAHPDWIIHTPGRPVSHGRHQYVLDFTRSEVVDHIYAMISKILRQAKISYVKWDMNREVVQPGHDGYAALDGQTKALYDLFDELR